MDIKKTIKPVYLYFISGVFLAIAFNLKESDLVLHYILGILGLGILIWAIIKYFRK